MKGNEKDCICHKPKGKHIKYCDAYRLSEFAARMASTIYGVSGKDSAIYKLDLNNKKLK